MSHGKWKPTSFPKEEGKGEEKRAQGVEEKEEEESGEEKEKKGKNKQ